MKGYYCVNASASREQTSTNYKRVVLGIGMSAVGLLGSLAQAETTIPSSSSAVVLQALAPGESDFILPNGSAIQSASGNGIEADGSQNWILNVQGNITAAVDGIRLTSALDGGAYITNSGRIQGVSGVGVEMLNGGTLVNQAAGVIMGNTGVSFSSGTYTLYNAGRIEGIDAGISVSTASASHFTNQYGGTIVGDVGVRMLSDGHTLTNLGAIEGTSGTAIDIHGDNNILILDEGTSLVGSVQSSGVGNALLLKGAGILNSNISGFSSLTMSGQTWALLGDIAMVQGSSPSLSIEDGKLILAGNLNANGGTTEIASGAELQIGNGGTRGDLQQSHVHLDGILSVFRSDGALDLSNTLTGNGILLFKGTGVSGQSYYSFSNNNNQFTGNIVLGNNVRLRIASSNPTPLSHIVVENNSTLWFGSAAKFSSPLFIKGQGWDDPGFGRLGALRLDSNAEVSGPVTLLDDARVTAVFSDYKGSISGAIGDGGHGYSLEKTGDGTITLTGINTYSGGTLINAGTLAIGRSESLGSDSGDVTLNHANATLSLLNAFSLNHNVVMGSQGGTITTASDNTLTGTLSGSGTFTKEGTGSLSLAATGSSVQNVNVSAGELALSQSGMFTALGNYTTASGAVTHLSDSASLRVNGVFTQQADSTLNLALGSADPLISVGSASLSGALNVTGLGPNVPNSASALTSTQYTLIHTSTPGVLAATSLPSA